MNPFNVICIDVSGKPNEIPQKVWDLLRKDETYTVIKATRLNVQGGLLGFQLAEIDLSPYEPYIYFSSSRFRLPKEVEVKEEELELVN